MRFPRLRYSLSTFLIVIALVAGFLGYHLRIKSQRQAMLAAITGQGGEYITYDAFHAHLLNIVSGNVLLNPLPRDMLAEEEKQAHISRIRTWLGDEPIAYIWLGKGHAMNSSRSNAEEDRIAKFFPEAPVIYVVEE